LYSKRPNRATCLRIANLEGARREALAGSVIRRWQRRKREASGFAIRREREGGWLVRGWLGSVGDRWCGVDQPVA
jgi:hypothetical protein